MDLLEQPLGEGFRSTDHLEEIHRHYLMRAMKEAGGVKTQSRRTARLRNYQTLAAQLERLEVETPDK